MSATVTRLVAAKLDSLAHKRIKRLTEAKHRAPDSLIREAFEQHVDREEKRESFRQDGTLAWVAFRATGLHVTHVEVDAWLEKLESGNDVELPACHI